MPAQPVSSSLRHRAITPWLFLAPSLAVLGVFFLGGLAQVVWYSFTKYTPFVDHPEFVGLANYRRLLASDRFWACLGNSAFYLLVTPLLVVLSLGAALVVDALARAGSWLRLVLFLPVVTPTIVAAVAWMIVLREDGGVINTLLRSVGLPGAPWLTGHPWTLMSGMLVTLWKGFGFYMMVFLAGLSAVPRELKEAAHLDGAGRWGAFRHVTLPALGPSVALVLVISSISALKVFEELYVTAKGAPIENQTVVPLIYVEAFEQGDYGMACAVGVTLFCVILSFSLVNLRLSRAGAGGAP